VSKKDQGPYRARHTLEFKLEAARLVKAGQEASVPVRVLGVPEQTMSNWGRLADKVALQGATERPASAEQTGLARLRAELARVKVERVKLERENAARVGSA
jgi:transposase-like protein